MNRSLPMVVLALIGLSAAGYVVWQKPDSLRALDFFNWSTFFTATADSDPDAAKGGKLPPSDEDPEIPGKPKYNNPTYLATADEVILKMFELANVNKDDVIFDLGCGDGRIL